VISREKKESELSENSTISQIDSMSKEELLSLQARIVKRLFDEGFFDNQEKTTK
jgi:hypothetical protein